MSTRLLQGDATFKRGRVTYFKRGRPLLKVTVPFVVAAMLAAPVALACDASLEATVAAKPDDTDSRDALARSCARAGRQEAALQQYDVLLAHDSANVDWLLGKSQALVALGRPREALPLLEDGRRRAPAYEDVWRLNANALEQLDEFDAADSLLAEAQKQFPTSTWPRERREALAERRLLERGTRLSADASYEDLSGGRPAWRGASIGLDRRLKGAGHLFAGLHLEERFDTRDEQLIVAWSDRLNEDWSYGVYGDVAPDAEVLPQWSVTAEAGRPLPDAWSIGLPPASRELRIRRRRDALGHGREVPGTASASATRSTSRRPPTSTIRASGTSFASRTITGAKVASDSPSASARKPRPWRPASCR